MKNELEEIKRTMQDITNALSKMITKVEVSFQKQTGDVAMQARKTLAGITNLLKSVDKKKEGEK